MRGELCPECNADDWEVTGSVLGWEGKTVKTYRCQDCGTTWQVSD